MFLLTFRAHVHARWVKTEHSAKKFAFFFFAHVQEAACKITYSLCCRKKLGASFDMRNVILVPFLAGQMHYRGKGKTLNHVIRNT